MTKRKQHPFDELVQRAYEESERIRVEDLDPGEPVKFSVSPHFRNIFEFEIKGEELDEIADAAEAAGIEIDDFVREAALARARSTQPIIRTSGKRTATVRSKARSA